MRQGTTAGMGRVRQGTVLCLTKPNILNAAQPDRQDTEPSPVSRMKGGAFLAKRNLIFLRAVVFALGVVLLVLGIWRGEPAEVMKKAVVVCLECIGIG